MEISELCCSLGEAVIFHKHTKVAEECWGVGAQDMAQKGIVSWAWFISEWLYTLEAACIIPTQGAWTHAIFKCCANESNANALSCLGIF